MYLLPTISVALKQELDNVQREDVRKKIKSVKGVLSAKFNAKTQQIDITYVGRSVKPALDKMEGISSYGGPFFL